MSGAGAERSAGRHGAGTDAVAELRVGIVGLGRWAVQHHVPAIEAHQLARLTAIAEPSPEKRALARERFGVEAAFAGHEELVASGLVDALIVASPPVAHHAAASAALDAGLHVLVEKPMTIAPQDADDLVARARAAGVALVVGYPFAFTPHADRARELVARIGELQLVSILFASPASHLLAGDWHTPGVDDPFAKPEPATFANPATAGGGQLPSQATHAIASVLGSSGARVQAVTAQVRDHGLAVDVADALLLELEGGALGTLASVGSLRVGQPAQHELRYYGTQGLVLHDLANGTLSASLHDGSAIDVPPLAAAERYPAQAPAQRLIDLALGATRDNPAPGELGAHAVEIVAAAHRSAANGGDRIPLTSTPEEARP